MTAASLAARWQPPVHGQRSAGRHCGRRVQGPWGSWHDGDVVKQVRTPPVRPADGWWDVYMSLSSRGRLSWYGAAGKIKSAEHAPACEMHRAARLEKTSPISDGFRRHPQTLSSPPPQSQVFSGTKDSAGCIGPVCWPAAAECLTC